MLVISDTVAIRITVLVHNRAGLAAASLAEYVGDFEVTPRIPKLRIPIHRTDTLHFFKVTIGTGHSVHYLLIACTGLYQINDFISITGFALLLHGHFAALFKSIGKIDTFVKMAAGVLVGVRAVRLLVEFLAVFEDVSTIFRGLTTGNVTMKRGKASVNRSMTQRRRTDEIYMSMKRFTFVTLFITHTPVDKGGQVKDSGLNTGMVKIMLNGIVNGDKPFPRLWHKNQPP